MRYTLIAVYTCLLLLLACDDEQQNAQQPPLLENKMRIECERRNRLCNDKDAMRFYRSMPRFYMAPDGSTQVDEVWSSFVVCCDVFQRMMDSLTSYNDMLQEAVLEGREFERRCVIDSMVTVSAGVDYYGTWTYTKRYEWLQFGDSTFQWLMPTGEGFNEHKEELEEAHRRCCLL
jgi:hypothetical protein